MNDIYNIKYKNYKKKYLLFKNFKQKGGFLTFIGSGTSGCLICPPIKPYIINPTLKITDSKYQDPEFSFDIQKYITCDYVGKILAIKDQGSSGDSYENELKQLLKIKELDPNGDYTPKLIYANIHLKKELFSIFDRDQDLILKPIKKCIGKKIISDHYGYIISKHTGVSLESKYNYIIPDTDISKLKNFLEKFNELLKFIKILYDNNYLHLDIKMNNITVKKEEDNKLYLIDFGRTIEMETDSDYHKISYSYLSQQYTMYPFEPKIYINLLSYYRTKKNLTKILFQDIIKFINKNFKILIFPYSFKDKDDVHSVQIRKILVEVFKNDNITSMDIDDYILQRQKNYFSIYLNKRKEKYFKEKFINEYKNEFLKKNKENFLNILKEKFINSSKEDFLINHKDDFFSEDSDIYWENNKDEYWDSLKDDVWEIYQESDIQEEYEKDFWKIYEKEFWEKYEEEYNKKYINKYAKEEIEIKFLLNYIFNPIINKFDLYCMGLVLAEIVLLKYKISDYNVLNNFEKLIQSILFNEFDDVSEIITKINELNSIIY